MSFFDEADEPRPASRTAPRRRGSSGGGRRPPHTDPQSIRVRRGVAAAVFVVLFILVVLGVHSCQVSARNSALTDYNANVVALAQKSNSTSRTFFSVLTTSGNAHSKQTSLNQAHDSATAELNQAKGFNVPDQVKDAQTDFVLALRMRSDALGDVAANIQPALASSTSQDAVSAIATDMARLYASDVLYKSYTLPAVLAALKSAGIAVTGPNAAQVEPGQFLPDIRWMTPTFVAAQLHATLPSSSSSSSSNKKPAAGTHGHHLVSVSVNGTALTDGGSASIVASPPPTFTLNFQNTGSNQETNVVCKVTVTAGVSGQTTVPQTNPGQQSSCNVTLNSAPPSGTYSVSATIERVPGEVNVTRNTQTFSLTFH